MPGKLADQVAGPGLETDSHAASVGLAFRKKNPVANRVLIVYLVWSGSGFRLSLAAVVRAESTLYNHLAVPFP